MLIINGIYITNLEYVTPQPRALKRHCKGEIATILDVLSKSFNVQTVE
jgi:hypothetical protein